ncbi:MAG: DUF1592 domain-containing protein [Rubripirellula sp.]
MTDSESAEPATLLSHRDLEFFETHCLDCHGADPEDISGNLDLARVIEQRQINELEDAVSIIAAISDHRMPPEDYSSPSEQEARTFTQSLERSLSIAINQSQRPASPTVRRMNRFQYNNAVMDLFELNCIVFTLPEKIMREHGRYFDPASGVMPEVITVGNRPLGKSQMIEPRLAGVAAFPQDLRAEHGYDNQGDHLSMSPLLMESFLQLGTSITQSPDFTRQRVGIWDSLFAEPSEGEPNQNVLEERLRPFINRAFRGRASDETISRYVSYGQKKLAEGRSYTETVKEIAAAVISSPKFYYLYTPTDTDGDQWQQGERNQARAFDLATRLSLFLWGSIPDQELLDLAASGSLTDRSVLDGQITRMLNDRKLKRFCDSFPSQWLQLERLISSIPNPDLYPDFYFSKYRRSMHMMLEPLLLFETVLIENRSILDLIDPNFTYRSSLLENAYGQLKTGTQVKPGRGGQVTTLDFQRIPLTDRRSGGVITNTAVMTMTSGPNRTQPITRGAWVAGVIFNSPPKPPPADVPPLQEETTNAAEPLSLREQLKIHRERSDCRGCHEQIDPLGFALENYDTVGQWRESYSNGARIVASGKIYGGDTFQNPVEFKDAVLAERDRFARAFTEHLFTYALARELTPHDRYAVQDVTSSTAENEYQLREVIRCIIHTDSFQSN